MISLLRRLLIDQWQRKCIAIILALFIWFIVDQSLMMTKTINNVSIRFINIPKNKTLEEVQNQQLIPQKTTITLLGKKSLLEDLNASDFEIVIDAKDQGDDFVATITKKNLFPLNPEINLQKSIVRIIQHPTFIIHMAEKKSDKIPVYIKIVGDPPAGYEYLEFYPLRLFIPYTGSAKDVAQLSQNGVPLILNLNNIKKSDLERLDPNPGFPRGDVISYIVPDTDKFIELPKSPDKVQIDDPNAKSLRIDFIRSTNYSLSRPIPVTLYFPLELQETINPQTLQIGENQFIEIANGIVQTKIPLQVKNVSKLFLEAAQDMMEIVVIPKMQGDKLQFTWELQFACPAACEELYVSTMLKDKTQEDLRDLAVAEREDYLRGRFRLFMRKLKLYTQDGKPLTLQISNHGGKVEIIPVAPKAK